MSGVYDSVPFAADLDRWRLQTQFTSGEVEQIASVSGTVVSRWFDSDLLLPHETFRVGTSHVLGHRRILRSGLVRLFREFKMWQALINIGETPSCYAAYVGPDADSCRQALCANLRDIASPPDQFALGQLIFRDRPMVVIVDFTGDDQSCDDYNGLIRTCDLIRTTTALDPAMRPAVLGFGIPGADAAHVDRAVSTADDLYREAVKICGARLSA